MRTHQPLSSRLPVRDSSLIALFWGSRLSWMGSGAHQLCGTDTLCPSAEPGEEPGIMSMVGEEGDAKGRGCFQRGAVLDLALLPLGS